MSSGKQTSFQYGEVDPINHYKSNDASYSNALHSLHNMYVRRAGGISRRPGTKHLLILPNQDDTFLEVFTSQKYKIFSFPYVELGIRTLGLITIHYTSSLSDQVTISVYKNMFGAAVETSTGYEISRDTGLKDVKIVYADGAAYIHGLSETVGHDQVMVVVNYLSDSSATPSLEIVTFSTPLYPITGVAVERGSLVPASALLTAVQYLFTIVLSDGREIPIHIIKSTRYDGRGFIDPLPALATEIVMPGDGKLTGMRVTLSVPGDQAALARSVKVYRAPVGAGSQSKGAHVLVYSLSVSPFATYPIATPPVTEYLTVSFSDSGASVPSITPPIDYTMFSYISGGSLAIKGTICSCVYQERHIIGVNGLNNPTFDVGNMLVSKTGGIRQLARPIIYRDIEAFQMSIPISDGTPVRQLISAERLIAFSDSGTYVIQGGESGILTPTSINPIQISTEGASKYVTPLMVGRNIVYLNNSHTKLMAVVFGDNSRGAAVELGKLADHLLDHNDFIEMELLPGLEDTVLLLKQNGELLIVTINEEGIAGFATMDMNGGRVESMTSFGDPIEKTLLLTITRNGIRSFETIGREEGVKNTRRLSYSDSSIIIGDRLLSPTTQGYPKLAPYADNITDEAVEAAIRYEYMNIESVDYSMGQTLTIKTTNDITLGSSTYIVKYIYEMDGDTRALYLYLDPSSASFDGTYWNTDATADMDIPLYLQDVEGNSSLTDEEKLLRKSRWLRAYTRLEGTTYTLGLAALYLLLKEDATYVPISAPDGEVDVSILAEGRVISSPLNTPQMATSKLIKDSSSVYPYIEFQEPLTYFEIGAPYLSYMQTLPIEVGGERTLTDDKKIVDKAGIALYKTVGGYVGMPDKSLENMAPISTRETLNPGEVDEGFSGYIAPILPSQWTKEGMIKIIQPDPVPMTVLSVYPKGQAGD